MNELEQLRQEAEHLKNAIREGRKAACDTSLAQVGGEVTRMKSPNHQLMYRTCQTRCATHMPMLYSHRNYQWQFSVFLGGGNPDSHQIFIVDLSENLK